MGKCWVKCYGFRGREDVLLLWMWTVGIANKIVEENMKHRGQNKTCSSPPPLSTQGYVSDCGG